MVPAGLQPRAIHHPPTPETELRIDPRTPVVVGAGSITQRSDDPESARSAAELMMAATDAAFAQTGSSTLARRTGMVLVPHGTWSDANPAGQVAARVGAEGARTVQSEIGVLQQSLITRACRAISAGKADVVVVTGGEAKNTARLDAREGRSTERQGSRDEGRWGDPDEILRPGQELIPRVEIERHLAVPAHQYAIIESSLRAAEGMSLGEHRKVISELWAAFARVAATREEAWDTSCPSAEAIATPSKSNRIVATPYTKLMCSQWNVDQASALIVASVDAARDAGVLSDGWVFPLAASESNHVVPLSRRRLLHRWPSFATTARRALDLAGVDMDEVAMIDLYSCFPSAVRIQARELGLQSARAMTVTGGMTFGGGPFNNYVLQSTVETVRLLRRQPGGIGLVTSVSGFLSKPAVAVWGSRPPGGGFRDADTTAEDERSHDALALEPDATGDATVAGSTVVFERGAPSKALAVLELRSGARTVGVSDDGDLVSSMASEEWNGRRVSIAEPGRFG